DAAVEETRQVPLAAIEHGLRILAGAGLVAARQVAVAQAEEEEGEAKKAERADHHNFRAENEGPNRCQITTELAGRDRHGMKTVLGFVICARNRKRFHATILCACASCNR